MNNYDDILNHSPAEKPPQISKEEYSEKKQAERDALYETSDAAALEVASNSADFQKYLDTQARLTRYSAVNTLLIMEVKPEATRLGDFDYWKGKKCSIKAGEVGISILEPKEYIKADNTVGVGYNVKKVFDISQVNTKRLKVTPPPSYDDRQLLKALVHKLPVPIRAVDEIPNGGGAMTDPQTGEIFVLKGMEFKDTFRCVANQIALTEVDKDYVADPQFTAYCASYILCKKHGVDTKDYSFDDVEHMFSGMDSREIKSELTQIRDTANEVLGRMHRQLNTPQKESKSQDARS